MPCGSRRFSVGELPFIRLAQAILTAVRDPRCALSRSSRSSSRRCSPGTACAAVTTRSAPRSSIALAGSLAEFGVWLGRSAAALLRSLPRFAEDEALPHVAPAPAPSAQTSAASRARIAACDREIKAHARQSEDAQRISALTGIGPLTASAFIATVSNARDFLTVGRWPPGRVRPKQPSSGGKVRLGVITKRGDTYLRGLLTQGARSTLQSALARSPRNARASNTGSSPCTRVSVTTKPWSRSPTNTCASSGRSSPRARTTTQTPGSATPTRAPNDSLPARCASRSTTRSDRAR